jgi:AraC-like DNA-binding protein
MRLAVYDLVGALVAPVEPAPSRHADKLFTRVRSIIKDGFADPDFCPDEAAARAGISLRYLQKLFTQRGSTCSEFIYSFRLDQAARLLHRRAELAANQHLSEIAYACGFRGYAHFARQFRPRFGRAPSARPARIYSRPAAARMSVRDRLTTTPAAKRLAIDGEGPLILDEPNLMLAASPGRVRPRLSQRMECRGRPRGRLACSRAG